MRRQVVFMLEAVSNRLILYVFSSVLSTFRNLLRYLLYSSCNNGLFNEFLCNWCLVFMHQRNEALIHDLEVFGDAIGFVFFLQYLKYVFFL